MNNKLKTILAVAGLAMSFNVSAVAAPIYTDSNGFVIMDRSSLASQNTAAVQLTLTNLGYFIGSQGINGVMNKSTRNAIKQFQADAGLKVDGVVGLQTADMLNRFTDGTQFGYNGYRAPVKYAPVNYYPNQVYYNSSANRAANGIYW